MSSTTRFDIPRILRDFHILHTPANSRGWIQLDCPRCHRPHLGLHSDSGVFSCWYCKKLPWKSTWSAFLGVSEELVVGSLRRYSLTGQNSSNPRKNVVLEPCAGNYRPPPTVPLTKGHEQYLLRRGLIPAELVTRWQVASVPGYVSTVGNRVFMPLVFNGESVSWQARTVFADVLPRYLTASKEEEAIFHKDIVYGWDEAAMIGQAVVVEGAFDVWKLGPGAVHTFGVQYMPAQVKLLATLDRVLVAYDSEPIAQRAGRNLAMELAALGVKAEYIDLEIAKDPGDLSISEARGIMSELGFPTDQENGHDQNP